MNIIERFRPLHCRPIHCRPIQCRHNQFGPIQFVVVQSIRYSNSLIAIVLLTFQISCGPSEYPTATSGSLIRASEEIGIATEDDIDDQNLEETNLNDSDSYFDDTNESDSEDLFDLDEATPEELVELSVGAEFDQIADSASLIEIFDRLNHESLQRYQAHDNFFVALEDLDAIDESDEFDNSFFTGRTDLEFGNEDDLFDRSTERSSEQRYESGYLSYGKRKALKQTPGQRSKPQQPKKKRSHSAKKPSSKRQPRTSPAPAITSGTSISRILAAANMKGLSMGASIGGTAGVALHDAQIFTPASITKVLTTAQALHKLGSNYRFETRLQWQNLQAGDKTRITNLKIFGSGDPTVGLSEFEKRPLERIKQLTEKLFEQGVREVHGPVELVSIDRRWDQPVHAPGVEASDHLLCYGALSQAFNVRGNCASFILSGTTMSRWADRALQFPVELHLEKGKTTSLRFSPRFSSEGAAVAYVVKGTWASTRKGQVVVRLPVPYAKDYYRNIFIRELKTAGIGYHNGASTGIVGKDLARDATGTPAKRSLLSDARGETNQASVFSQTLGEILVPMLRESDNFLADAFFKRVGVAESAYSNKSLREAAQLTLADSLEQWMKIIGLTPPAKETVFLDGAGLSRLNRVSARVFTGALSVFPKEKYFGNLWRGFPIAGMNGTLKNRLKRAPVRGVVRAKTGTVRGSYQLAGYVPKYGPGNNVPELVPFSILSQTTPSRRFQVKSIHESVLMRLVGVVNPKLPPETLRRQAEEKLSTGAITVADRPSSGFRNLSAASNLMTFMEVNRPSSMLHKKIWGHFDVYYPARLLQIH